MISRCSGLALEAESLLFTCGDSSPAYDQCGVGGSDVKPVFWLGSSESGALESRLPQIHLCMRTVVSRSRSSGGEEVSNQPVTTVV